MLLKTFLLDLMQNTGFQPKFCQKYTEQVKRICLS